MQTEHIFAIAFIVTKKRWITFPAPNPYLQGQYTEWIFCSQGVIYFQK